MATNREQLEFETLYTKFRNGLRKITATLKETGTNPWIAREIARFRAELEIPMDEMWLRYSDKQKDEFLKREELYG